MNDFFFFDADTHMSPYKNFDLSIDAGQWEEIMAEAGVDKALAWLLPQNVSDVAESNAYLYAQAAANPRIVPFGWANVGEGVEKAKEDARKCMQEYGFKGVKLNGAQNEYYIDSPEALEVLRVIAENGGIIAFHIGADYPQYTDPVRAAVCAEMFPETPVLMIHMGGAAEPDVSERVIAVAKDHPNMYLVGSAIHVDKVKSAIDILGADRVLFGSDTPFFSLKDHKKAYLEMLSGYSEADQRKVMGGNARVLFGL